MAVLKDFPSKNPLRVYFSKVRSTLKEDEIFSHFNSKVKGLINIVLESQGSGHFIVANCDAAEGLIKCEGDFIAGNHIHF